MWKSLRAVRIAERNSYIENTPLGTPSGTAKRKKRLFFWLQKSGVNCEKCKRYTLSGDTTPQSKPTVLTAPLAQGSRERTAGGGVWGLHPPRHRPLPFRGGAAAAAEGVTIVPFFTARLYSVWKSFRTVSIAERNRYIENTPLGSPSGTALRLESTLYSVESLFPLSKGESHAGA